MINDMEKEFIRVRSIKDIITFVSLIILGSVLVAIPTGPAVNITGFFMIFAGIILLLVLKTGFKDSETGEKYQKKEHYFQQAMHTEVSSAIASRPESVDLGQADKGNALKLDVYFNRTAGKAYLQLFEYVPHSHYRYVSKLFSSAQFL
jgi:hypothetical protein